MPLADVKPAARPPVRPRPDEDGYDLDPFITAARRHLRPGSAGWTADELMRGPLANDFEVARLELINGVLTSMPAKMLAGKSLFRLLVILDAAAKDAGQEGIIWQEAVMQIDADHAPQADGVFITREQDTLQMREATARGYPDHEDAPLFVPPLVLVEALSQGHKRHDRVTKRALYAAWGVPHYWLFDAYARRLDCLKLDPAKGQYVDDVAGEGDAEVRPSLPFALTIPLARLWPK